MNETRFRTIVADPPWRYKGTRSVPSKRGGPVPWTAEGQYSTMSNRQIRDLAVADLAAPSAHLYLWVTVPRLFGERRSREVSPLDILEAWGFEFKTMLTWVKTGPGGMGWYFRGNAEHVLFGVRGKAPIAPSARVSNVFTAPRSGHSAKPDLFYDIVEQVSPGPYLELFARRARFGWEYAGNESLSTVQVEGIAA